MKVPQSSTVEFLRLAQNGGLPVVSQGAVPRFRYAITDRRLWGDSEPQQIAGLLRQARRLALLGFDFLQLREKDLSARSLAALARDLLEVLRSTEAGPPAFPGRQTRLLVNSRADVAAAAGAGGVHLPSGRGQITPAQARTILERGEYSRAAPRPIVSVSCHTLAEVEYARDGGADLLLFSPVFGKSVRGEAILPAVGLDALAAACAAAGNVPVLALGGVTEENAPECIAAGAAGVAGIRLFL